MLKKIKSKLARYKLSITASCALIVLSALTFLTFFQLVTASLEKSRVIRSELVNRDLRELASQFDADERYVLENNLQELIHEKRQTSPLLLPRQYYVALPTNTNGFTPRPPPRNCFIDLASINNKTEEKFAEKFCSYFAESKSLGEYLFFSMAFVDEESNPHRIGDTSFSADTIKIRISNGNTSNTWWLVLQSPQNGTRKGRYQLTAFRELPDERKELDRRFEGWAYIQKQANKAQVLNILARLDIKEFFPNSLHEQHWPPSNWRNLRINVSRKDFSAADKTFRWINYSESNKTNSSLASLSSAIFNAYASLEVQLNNRSYAVPPPAALSSKTQTENGFIRIADGDLLIRKKGITSSILLQDTNITFVVNHPATVIEKGIWRTGSLLFILMVGFLLTTGYLFLKLLIPIWKLSRRSRQISSDTTSGQNLPYSEKNDEIGALARGFNELLTETRSHAQRERIEHENRVKTRELNLKVIGHEILSPLQALRSLHNNQSSSWRYIDRITRAMNQLFGGGGPEASFDSREVNLEKVDLCLFLDQVAKNAPLANIPEVRFLSPASSVELLCDTTMLEDAITNILTNACRYRNLNSPIVISLSTTAEEATIAIENEGPKIPDTDLERVFDLYFTTQKPTGEELHGIGLFAARNYIAKMAGRIFAQNTLVGVRIVLVFPTPK